MPGGPKLVKIDLATNKVVQTYRVRHRRGAAGQLPQRRPVLARTANGPTSPIRAPPARSSWSTSPPARGGACSKATCRPMPDKSVKVDGRRASNSASPTGAVSQFAADSHLDRPEGRVPLLAAADRREALPDRRPPRCRTRAWPPDQVKAKVEKVDGQPAERRALDRQERAASSSPTSRTDAIKTLSRMAAATTLVQDPRLRLARHLCGRARTRPFTSRIPRSTNSPRFNAQGWTSTILQPVEDRAESGERGRSQPGLCRSVDEAPERRSGKPAPALVATASALITGWAALASAGISGCVPGGMLTGSGLGSITSGPGWGTFSGSSCGYSLGVGVSAGSG